MGAYPILPAALYGIMVVMLKRFAGQLKNRAAMIRPCNTEEATA